MAFLFRRRGRIGVVEMFGMIGPVVRSSVHYQLLDRLERSPRIGAVLLDIDSPGGAVAASESLFAKVDRVRQKKPVVAFIRGSGTSGAYMVACPATKVIALPGALVGSIGVISVRPMVAGLLERLGVSVSVSKSGPLKDMGAFYRPPTEEELKKLQSLIDELFESFVERVAKARGLETEQVRGFATGCSRQSGAWSWGWWTSWGTSTTPWTWRRRWATCHGGPPTCGHPVGCESGPWGGSLPGRWRGCGRRGTPRWASGCGMCEVL